MGVEQWLIARLRAFKAYVPGAWTVSLSRGIRWGLGWLLLPCEFVVFCLSQLRWGWRAGPRGPGLSVVIVEPFLGSKPSFGHEMPFSLTVATRLREQGINVHVLGHGRLPAAIAAAFEARGIPCRGVFGPSGLEMMPLSDADRRIVALGRFVALAFAYAADLTRGLAQSRVPLPRVLFFPTSGLSCMLGASLRRWPPFCRGRGEWQLHVVHGLLQIGGRHSYTAWIRRWLRASSPGRLHIGTVNPHVSAALRSFGEAEAMAVPIPSPLGIRVPASTRGPRRVGFLGSAYHGKGFTRLPGLLPKLLERHDSLRIVVQAAPHFPHPLIVEATDRLRALARQSDRIELVERPLAMDEYYALLAGLDVIVLPYDPATYALKISSVAIEAMTLGKVVVGPGVGWFGEQPEVYGGYLAADTGDTEELACRVLEAVGDFDRLSRRAARDAPRFRWHNVQTLVTQLTQLAAPDGIDPRRGLSMAR